MTIATVAVPVLIQSAWAFFDLTEPASISSVLKEAVSMETLPPDDWLFQPETIGTFRL